MLRTRSRMLRWVAVMASGGSLMVLDTCNPQVRDTILGGVSSAATGLTSTFIQAFFEGLAQNDDDRVL
jgi:hypothetical protein